MQNGKNACERRASVCRSTSSREAMYFFSSSCFSKSTCNPSERSKGGDAAAIGGACPLHLGVPRVMRASVFLPFSRARV
eukprot:2963210-Pleurochrysis_carterae.AAC.2